jgi:acyl-CoA synthetase (AMP-forming)/AMP-acid ligase II
VLIDGLPLEAPAAPLNDLLRVGLEATPEEPALVSAERSMSWLELESEAERLAGGYRELGLEPGDRIASLMPNRDALIVHYLACFKAGLVVTPLNYRYTHREIDHALAVSGAKALVAHRGAGQEDVIAVELEGRAGGDLLHLGQHRAGEGRHPHPLLAALDDRQRRRGLRARRR